MLSTLYVHSHEVLVFITTIFIGSSNAVLFARDYHHLRFVVYGHGAPVLGMTFPTHTAAVGSHVNFPDSAPPEEVHV